MREWHLRRFLTACACGLALSAHARAEDIPPGVVAIQAGKITPAESKGFSGSGFLISGGWVVTARHVVKSIEGKYGPDYIYVTLGSRVPSTNPIEVTKVTCPKDAVDICFLKLDAASDHLAGPLAQPFDLLCRRTGIDGHRLTTWGFADNSNDSFKVTDSITSFDGTYVPTGSTTRYSDLIRTGAVTSGGVSGAPVMLEGTRTVIGVHTGTLTNSQVLAPLYNLDVPVTSAGVEIACTNSPPTLKERTKSIVMNYVAGTLDPEPEEEIRRLIVNEVKYVRDWVRAQPGGTESYAYLDQAKPFDSGKEFSDQAQIEAIWQADPSAIQILWGEFVASTAPSAPFSIVSEIFLGDLPSQGGVSDTRNDFLVSSSNRVSDFRQIADGHHLVMLYAMILDARRLDKPSNVVLGLIAAAEYVKNELRPKGALVGDMAFISSQIDAIRAEYGM